MARNPDFTLKGKPLSPRQLLAIQLICKGLCNKEISVAMNIELDGVKSTIRDAYRKMNVHSRSEAMIYAVRNRLVEFI